MSEYMWLEQSSLDAMKKKYESFYSKHGHALGGEVGLLMPTLNMHREIVATNIRMPLPGGDTPTGDFHAIFAVTRGGWNLLQTIFHRLLWMVGMEVAKSQGISLRHCIDKDTNTPRWIIDAVLTVENKAEFVRNLHKAFDEVLKHSMPMSHKVE